MIDFVHDKTNCPEWKNPGESRIEISKVSILKEFGKSSEEIENILEEEQSLDDEDEVLNNLPYYFIRDQEKCHLHKSLMD
ncbi:MAG: hypothetical protein WCQ67_05180 [Treponema sp.]